MNILFESNLFFEVMDFSLTHKTLLLRGIEILENGEDSITHKNIDVLFGGVHFLSIPTSFDGGICIKRGEIDKHLSFDNYKRNLKKDKYLEIINKGEVFYVESFGIEILINSLDTSESSIDGKKYRNMDNYAPKQQIEMFPYMIEALKNQLSAYIKTNVKYWQNSSTDEKKEIIKIFLPEILMIKDSTLDELSNSFNSSFS